MKLQPIAPILAELKRQGFYVETWVWTPREGVTIMVSSVMDDHHEREIAHFAHESQSLKMRLYGLEQCRKAGFIWPD